MDFLPLPIEATRKSSMCSLSGEYEDFLKDNYDFLMYGPSQLSIKMLDALINLKSVPLEHVKNQLRLLIFNILDEIALNTLQVAYWTILIQKYAWSEEDLELRLSLTFTALYTKESLGDTIEYLLHKFSQKEDMFQEMYCKWCDDKKIDLISIADINKQYNRLVCSKFNEINYNFYVDDIILHYLPYNNPKKKDLRKNNHMIVLPPIETIRHEATRSSEPLPKLAQFGEEMLTPLPLMKNSGDNKMQTIYSNGNSGCSQFLCFDA